MPRGLEQIPTTNPSEFDSAPSSADFYRDELDANARTDFLEVTYQPDELPSVKDLSTDFDYLLDDINNSKIRRDTAIEYLSHLKARFKPGEYSNSELNYERSQILPRLFLDMLSLTANRQRYQNLVKRSEMRRSPETMPALSDLIGSKIDLQIDIADYVRMNPQSNTMSLYGNLTLLMHHSRRILYGDNVTDEFVRQKNLGHLSGILAEYKVLSALLETWPQATFGSIEQDAGGNDIVVPSANRPNRGAALQVKSSRSPSCEFGIRDKLVPIPVVVIPMDISQHDPLKLSPAHSEIVRNYIIDSPRYSLATAA